MNLKQAKRLRRLVELQDCQSVYTQYVASSKRGQHNCLEVWANCQRGIYLRAKKILKNQGQLLQAIENKTICL